MRVATQPRLERGLRRYVALVAAELGVAPDACWVEAPGHPMSAYLALSKRLPRHPDRDVALVWDKEHGWAVALETTPREWPLSWQGLIPLTYLGDDLLPAPSAVAAFVAALLDHHGPGRPDAPTFSGADRDDLARRLIAYATWTGRHRRWFRR